MSGRRGLAMTVLVLLLCALWPGAAAADGIDDAFAEGNEAAARNDWPAAVAAFEDAAAALPHRNALVSYNLGTAYANVGDLGRATYHLHRAMDWRGGPTSDILEAARANLAAVRRGIELQATAKSNMVDRPQTSWDLIVEAFATSGIGWLSLVCGGLFLATLLLHRRRLRAEKPGLNATRVALVVLGICYAGPGLLHAWAIRADAQSPEAIVLDAQADARQGPGNHEKVRFTVQGGAKVRVMDRSPGWQLVRLPGGVQGWVPEQSVGRIDALRAVAGRPSSRS